MSAKIRYALVGHHLTEEKNFHARVLPARTATIEDVVDHVVQQGSTVTRTDILGVFEGICAAIEHLVLEENARVVTPLVNCFVGIKGLFDRSDDAFDPERHQVTGRVTVGVRLQKAIEARAEVERRPRPILAPQPSEFLDVTSGEWNGALTPGRMAKLKGKRLKIDPTDETQGVFFVDADGNMARVALFADNLPSKLTFEVPPDLAPGSYRLVVQTLDGVGALTWDRIEILLTV